MTTDKDLQTLQAQAALKGYEVRQVIRIYSHAKTYWFESVAEALAALEKLKAVQQ